MYRFPSLSTLLATALFALTLTVPSAFASKTIQLKLKNDSPDKYMSCTVKKVALNGAKSTLKSYSLKPKNQLPSSLRGKYETHSLRVSYIVKRIDRSVVYPKLELTCKLSTPNTQRSSPHWDDTDKGFTTHRFNAFCASGAYCTASIERR